MDIFNIINIFINLKGRSTQKPDEFSILKKALRSININAFEKT